MKRSKHSLSHYRLMSSAMGYLAPCGLLEVLPGDTFQHAASLLVRTMPMLAPVMHPVHIRVHHFFVPHRLVWEDWEDFITGGPDGLDASVFPTITLDATSGAVGSLADHLGCPPVTGLEVSALPFRAYALIWNEFYRDQDLQTALTIDLTSGADTTTNTTLQRVAWEKDYFTSARPWTQKGAEVTLPLAGEAPVLGIGVTANANNGAVANVRESDGGTANYADSWVANNVASPTVIEEDGTTNYPNIRADLTGVTAATVNDLRLALALQRYEEARARYGSRYTEFLRYLGVKSSDARLQRPEYLGGGKQTLQWSEVLRTSSSTGEEPVGWMTGHGIGAVRSNRYRRFFEEHGYVISLVSVRPKTVYSQSLARTWNRRTKEDFWQRELEHLGQQEVLLKEVYAPAGSPNQVFGFQDRYDEYRRQESGVSGQFRTDLNFWHMARDFAAQPALNASFVAAVPTDRVFALENLDTLWMMVNHSVQARRLVSSVARPMIF